MQEKECLCDWWLTGASLRSIEGEYVPVAGDEVTYKMCTIPPKNEKLQAVEVVITHLAPGTKHETWSGHIISSWASPGNAAAAGVGSAQQPAAGTWLKNIVCEEILHCQ